MSSKFFHSLRSYVNKRKMDFDNVSKFLMSYQHWTFYPVTCFSMINLLAQSMLLLLSKKKVPNRGQELLDCHILAMGERVMVVISSFSVTGIQHIQFCLNHFSLNIYVETPYDNDRLEK
ncbi:hypothetical protein Taro_021362 [Colocasia esculenta]|uniref:Uncharacterized protein n=1 Tax=Colocasia esculenta TaxID=4460 RepID=A0A843UR75_COLES|nr:hypothetical protein [Colocasia esculenta]